MVCSPVGSGKTIMAVQYIIECINRGERVVVVAHRKELLSQIADTFRKSGYHNFVVTQSTPKNKINSPLVICGNKKIERSESLFNDPTLVVIDEAHRVPSKKYLEAVMRWNDTARYLGLSATPERDGVGKLFDEIIHPVHISELIEAKVLVPVEIVGANERTRVSFDEKAGGIDWEPISYYLKYAKGLKTIFYTLDRSQNKKIIDEMSKIGVKVHELSAETPTNERDQIIKDYAEGKIQCITNCMILTEGWDSDVDVIILTRPCLDKRTFNQISGRGMRMSRPDKLKCVLVDLTGAYTEHGSPDSDQWYSIVGSSKKLFCLNCGADLQRSDWILKRDPNCSWCAESECLNPHCPECNFHYEIPKAGRAEGLQPKQKKMFPETMIELVDVILSRCPAMVTTLKGVDAALKNPHERDKALAWQARNSARDTDAVKRATYMALVALRDRINTKRREKKMIPYRFNWCAMIYSNWYGVYPPTELQTEMRRYE
jgi:hypothetical protein